MQLFLFLFPLQHIKRPALRNKQVVVLRMAFRARKVLGTFEKRAPGLFGIALAQLNSRFALSDNSRKEVIIIIHLLKSQV